MFEVYPPYLHWDPVYASNTYFLHVSSGKLFILSDGRTEDMFNAGTVSSQISDCCVKFTGPLISSLVQHVLYSYKKKTLKSAPFYCLQFCPSFRDKKGRNTLSMQSLRTLCRVSLCISLSPRNPGSHNTNRKQLPSQICAFSDHRCALPCCLFL